MDGNFQTQHLWFEWDRLTQELSLRDHSTTLGHRVLGNQGTDGYLQHGNYLIKTIPPSSA